MEAETTIDPQTRTAEWMRRAQDFLREYAFPIVVFVILRAWTMLWASITAAFVPLAAQASHFYYGMTPLNDLFFAPWQRWDTIWYTKIAVEGYVPGEGSNFPPFYPFLIRLLLPLTGNNAVVAGLVISGAAALASLILLYHLTDTLYGKTAARRAVLFLGTFPTAFFLFAAYTESLFLALALGAFLCARSSRWGCAGIFGAFAAMTRSQGMLLVLPLAVEFWAQYRRGQVTLSRVWTLVPVVIGGMAHIGVIAVRFGDLTAWFQSESVAHRFSLPWNTLFAGWMAVWNAPSAFEAALSLLDPLCIILLLAALVWSARRLPLSMTVYLAVIIAPSLFVLTTYSDAYPLTSVSRFAVLAFPLFLLLGALRPRWWDSLAVAGSFLLQTLLLVLFSAWVFVR